MLSFSEQALLALERKIQKGTALFWVRPSPGCITTASLESLCQTFLAREAELQKHATPPTASWGRAVCARFCASLHCKLFVRRPHPA